MLIIHKVSDISVKNRISFSNYTLSKFVTTPDENIRIYKRCLLIIWCYITGIKELIADQTYIAAYPLHDVSTCAQT